MLAIMRAKFPKEGFNKLEVFTKLPEDEKKKKKKNRGNKSRRRRERRRTCLKERLIV